MKMLLILFLLPVALCGDIEELLGFKADFFKSSENPFKSDKKLLLSGSKSDLLKSVHKKLDDKKVLGGIFKAYKRNFNKKYEQEEEDNRMAILNRNMKKIAEHNLKVKTLYYDEC